MTAKERLESPYETAMQVLEVRLQARGQVQVACLQKHNGTHLGTLVPHSRHFEPLDTRAFQQHILTCQGCRQHPIRIQDSRAGPSSKGELIPISSNISITTIGDPIPIQFNQ